MKLFRILFLSLSIGHSSNACAFSGAEFMQASEDFSAGYAWGSLNGWLSLDKDDSASMKDWRLNLWKCFDAANIKSGTFYDAVKANIAEHQNLLSLKVEVAIIDTAINICR
jgi:hypothetical protein